MIYGDQIRLRAIEPDDLPRFVNWFNDPEVIKHLDMVLPMSAADEEDWFQQIRKQPPPERPFAIDVFENGEWQHIGSCGFLHVDSVNRNAEFGISIGSKEHWSKGLGTEVVRTLLELGFSTLNLHRVYLRVFEENLRGIRAYEKAGFVLEGRLREAKYMDGKYQDVLYMGILKDEWISGKEKAG